MRQGCRAGEEGVQSVLRLCRGESADLLVGRLDEAVDRARQREGELDVEAPLQHELAVVLRLRRRECALPLQLKQLAHLRRREKAGRKA